MSHRSYVGICKGRYGRGCIRKKNTDKSVNLYALGKEYLCGSCRNSMSKSKKRKKREFRLFSI